MWYYKLVLSSVLLLSTVAWATSSPATTKDEIKQVRNEVPPLHGLRRPYSYYVLPSASMSKTTRSASTLSAFATSNSTSSTGIFYSISSLSLSSNTGTLTFSVSSSTRAVGNILMTSNKSPGEGMFPVGSTSMSTSTSFKTTMINQLPFISESFMSTQISRGMSTAISTQDAKPTSSSHFVSSTQRTAGIPKAAYSGSRKVGYSIFSVRSTQTCRGDNAASSCVFRTRSSPSTDIKPTPSPSNSIFSASPPSKQSTPSEISKDTSVQSSRSHSEKAKAAHSSHSSNSTRSSDPTKSTSPSYMTTLTPLLPFSTRRSDDTLSSMSSSRITSSSLAAFSSPLLSKSTRAIRTTTITRIFTITTSRSRTSSTTSTTAITATTATTTATSPPLLSSPLYPSYTPHSPQSEPLTSAYP